MKFYGGACGGKSNKWLDFGSDPPKLVIPSSSVIWIVPCSVLYPGPLILQIMSHSVDVQ